MSKLYNPQSIHEALFEEGKEIDSMSVQVVSTGEKIVFETVTVESLVGKDESSGQYAMIKGTPEEHEKTKGLKISSKRSENGKIVDILASGNVANPYIFNKEQAVVMSVTT
jgi:hypothetical protein